jgi:hypothetical protein
MDTHLGTFQTESEAHERVQQFLWDQVRDLKVQAQKAAEHYKHVSELVKYSELNMDKCVYKYFCDEKIIQCHKKKSKQLQKLARNKKAEEKQRLKVKKWTPPTLDPITSSDEEESKMHWDSDDYAFCHSAETITHAKIAWKTRN